MLPLKLILSKFILIRITIPKQNSEKLTKKFVLGMSMSSKNNLLYNPYQRYFVFSVTNKVIVEYLEELRYQIILEDSQDEISVRLFYFIGFNFFS